MQRAVWPALALTALWAFSCGDGAATQDGTAQSNGNTNGNGSAGSSALQPEDENTIGLDIGQGDASIIPPLSADNACLSQVNEAETVAVDLFVMLDRSVSMLEFVGDGSSQLSKWDAVTTALTEFVQNPATDQIGLGLRMFPQGYDGLAPECFDDADCMDRGVCSIPGQCLYPPTIPLQSECLSNIGCPHWDDPTRGGYCDRTGKACSSSAECNPRDGTCVAIPCSNAMCENTDADGNEYVCVLGGSCAELGACSIPSGGMCEADSCDVTDYSTPDAPITLGADRNATLLAALNASEPTGRTPTAPALQGAIDYAASWAGAHPDRVAAVVLATDGLPSRCAAAGVTSTAGAVQEVEQIAQQGTGLNPPVRTYVVGVVSQRDDQEQGASTHLQGMAQAGGTGQAFLVSAEGNVTDDFLAALQSISANAISCEFQLPADDQLDFGTVNLLFTRSDGQAVQLVNVGSPEGCGGDNAIGWYYLKDPETGVPYQISVCPGVCDQFAQSGGGRVDLQIGCETIIR